MTIEIEQWDDDDPYDAEQCAVTSTGGNVLSLTVDLPTCTIRGAVNGRCGDRFHIVGAGILPSNPDLYLDFTVNVLQPVAAPGLNVRCTHDPLWPQPGQNVTMTPSWARDHFKVSRLGGARAGPHRPLHYASCCGGGPAAARVDPCDRASPHQTSTASPVTRRNSRWLRVTRVVPELKQVAAIIMSFAPIGVPSDSSCVRSTP